MMKSFAFFCVCLVSGILGLQAAEAPAKTQKVVLGAGCFWCLEAVYEEFPGVIEAVSGYAGGTTKNPTYKEVGGGKTGHAEVLEIEFDPAKISYEKLLEILWDSHDPTNARGVAPDFGPQYRSIILYRTPEEKAAAEKGKAALQKKLGKTVATEISALDIFYPAEDYHQNYVKENPNNSYVRNVSIPRVKETKARQQSKTAK